MAGLRMATATAITGCVALKIDRAEMIRVMRCMRSMPSRGLFFRFCLCAACEVQADLVDQLFNSSEKAAGADSAANGGVSAGRLQPESPAASEDRAKVDVLAEMIGTTRSRVSSFKNRFRGHGFVEYERSASGCIDLLLNIVLHDQLSYNTSNSVSFR